MYIHVHIYEVFIWRKNFPFPKLLHVHKTTVFHISLHLGQKPQRQKVNLYITKMVEEAKGFDKDVSQGGSGSEH